MEGTGDLDGPPTTLSSLRLQSKKQNKICDENRNVSFESKFGPPGSV